MFSLKDQSGAGHRRITRNRTRHGAGAGASRRARGGRRANTEKLAGVVAEIAAAGGEALAVAMDVADGEQVKSGFRQSHRKIREARYPGKQRRDHARRPGSADEGR